MLPEVQAPQKPALFPPPPSPGSSMSNSTSIRAHHTVIICNLPLLLPEVLFKPRSLLEVQALQRLSNFNRIMLCSEVLVLVRLLLLLEFRAHQ
jgi:hypothetical protein